MKNTTRIISVLLLLFQCIILFTTYSRLPSKIAIHLNLKGEVDNFGPKWMLFLIILLSLTLFSLFSYIRKRPEKFNYPYFNIEKKDIKYIKSQNLIDYLNISTMLILTYVLLLFTVFYDNVISSLVIILYILIFVPLVIIIAYIIDLYKVSKSN